MPHGGIESFIAQAGKVVVQPDGLGHIRGQMPGARHDGAHHRMVRAVCGILGLREGAVFARQGFCHCARIAAHGLHQHGHAHVAEKTEAVAQPRVKAVKLAANVFAGDGLALRAFPKMLQQRSTHMQGIAGDEGGKQLQGRLQAQHRECHAHSLDRLCQGVQRAVGGADHRSRHGHI